VLRELALREQGFGVVFLNLYAIEASLPKCGHRGDDLCGSFEPPPLLKEKSHMIVNTTVTYLTNPAWIDGPSATAAFTSNNDPSNSIEIEMVNRP
jgi:hypothetical protein